MTDAPAKEQFNVRLPRPIISAIAREAQRRQVSRTYIVERALLAWLERHHDPFTVSDE